MESTSTTSIKVARAGLAAVLAWNVIRAATQPVTPGEARNYVDFIAPQWREALSRYDANNHFLNTLLVRISTARIHLTEFSLRLPSLLAGALYIWAVYRLTRRCFGGGKVFLAVAGLLTLNPMVMDAMSEARGYGMALAAMMWAVVLVVEAWDRKESPEKNGAGQIGNPPHFAGVLLGLSVAASLAFLAPATALILVLAWRWKGRIGKIPHLAVLTAFMLLVLPLNHAEKPVVTQGAQTLFRTLDVLTAGSLGSNGAFVTVAARIAAGLLLLAGIAALVRKRSPLAYLMGGTLIATLLLILAAHAKAGAAFPEGGALYMIPIVTLLAAALVADAGRESVQVAFLAVAALGVAHYADHLRMEYRGTGELAGARDLAKALRADAHRRMVRIGASEDAEAVLRYYRSRYAQGNWQGIERAQPDASYDYYALTGADAGIVAQRGLRVLYRDPGLVLAK